MKTILSLATLLGSVVGSFAGEKAVPSTPYETLRSTTTFAIGGVGFAGTTTLGETAMRQLIRQPDGSTQFSKLLTEATPEGQMYALLGLHTLDAKAFATTVPKYLRSETQVRTMSGCIAGPKSIKQIITEIQTGKLK